MTQEHRRALVAQLNGRSQMDAFEAAKLIATAEDTSLATSLIAVLRHGRRPFNRTAAAYAMQGVRAMRVIEALERSVANTSEYPRVRGQAAESLIYNHRQRSHDVLLRELSDPSKEVRFWCAFALGQMAERRAIPGLEQLVENDKRIVKGFWSVAKEAADALKRIESEKRFHRGKGRCAFCIGLGTSPQRLKPRVFDR